MHPYHFSAVENMGNKNNIWFSVLTNEKSYVIDWPGAVYTV